MTESPDTCLRSGLYLLDLTRVKSGRACLPAAPRARNLGRAGVRAPIYNGLCLRRIPCLWPCGLRVVPVLMESSVKPLRCGWCLLDLTRVKSGRACLPRQARQPRQPDSRAPIYKPPDCGASLACRLAASSNRVGRSPTGGPLLRPSDKSRLVNAGKPFCVKPAKRPGCELSSGCPFGADRCRTGV